MAPSPHGFLSLAHSDKELVLAADYNKYGNRLVTGSADHRLRVYDLNERTQEWEGVDVWRGHNAAVLDARWSPMTPTKTLSSIGEDLKLKIWTEDPTETLLSGRRFKCLFSQSSPYSVVYASLDFARPRHDTFLAVVTRDGLLSLLEPSAASSLPGVPGAGGGGMISRPLDGDDSANDWKELDQFWVCDTPVPRGTETCFRVAFQHTEMPSYGALAAGLDPQALSLAVTAINDVRLYRITAGGTGGGGYYETGSGIGAGLAGSGGASGILPPGGGGGAGGGGGGGGNYRFYAPCAVLTGARALVRDVAWSPAVFRTHDLIATAAADGYVRVYELKALAERTPPPPGPPSPSPPQQSQQNPPERHPIGGSSTGSDGGRNISAPPSTMAHRPRPQSGIGAGLAGAAASSSSRGRGSASVHDPSSSLAAPFATNMSGNNNGGAFLPASSHSNPAASGPVLASNSSSASTANSSFNASNPSNSSSHDFNAGTAPPAPPAPPPPPSTSTTTTTTSNNNATNPGVATAWLASGQVKHEWKELAALRHEGVWRVEWVRSGSGNMLVSTGDNGRAVVWAMSQGGGGGGSGSSGGGSSGSGGSMGGKWMEFAEFGPESSPGDDDGEDIYGDEDGDEEANDEGDARDGDEGVGEDGFRRQQQQQQQQRDRDGDRDGEAERDRWVGDGASKERYSTGGGGGGRGSERGRGRGGGGGGGGGSGRRKRGGRGRGGGQQQGGGGRGGGGRGRFERGVGVGGGGGGERERGFGEGGGGGEDGEERGDGEEGEEGGEGEGVV